MSYKVLQDGFKTIYTFTEPSEIKFEEVTVQPPGIDGGGANALTNMRNTTYRTSAPKKLVDFTQSQCQVHYDPAIYSQIIAAINVNQLITVDFPDGSKVAFWGWINSFTPAALQEGQPPTADVTVIPSNLNASGAEIAPAYTAAPGGG